MAEQEKRTKPSVADKISDLIEAIRETKSDVKGSEVPLSTGEQLRKLFPSIPPHNGNTSSDIRNIQNSSRKGIEHFLKEHCHISRIFSFPIFLPFYKLLMDSV